MPVVDTLGRPLRNLRLSVTDRCNLRCRYCMPETDYVWVPKPDMLRFEEISRLVAIFIGLGVDKIRLTGGEPLLRRDLPHLVEMIAAHDGLRDLALTTNGVLLADQAEALKRAGLARVTVSLDTLKPDRFRDLTRLDMHADVMRGIDATTSVFGSIKIDSVMMRGVNDDEMVDLLEYGRRIGAEVRFIEYMDVAGATLWSPEQVLSRQEMLERMAAHYGAIVPLPESEWAPAERFALPDGTVFGIIASTTAPFCRTCDRSRVTADGAWYRCLYAPSGTDLRAPLRAGASDDEIEATIEQAWIGRQDRGAEVRLAERDRRALVPLSALRKDPHLEMHTRGG
jgi:cyclic pyranopterin phosphate synthase